MGLETLSYAAFSHPPIFYCEKCGLVFYHVRRLPLRAA